MNGFMVRPSVYKFETVRDFINDFKPGKDDFILTTKPVYDFNLKGLGIEAQIKFYETYGQGEPSDEKVERIYKDITGTPKRIIAIGGGSVLDIAKLFCLRRVTPVVDLYEGKFEPIKDKELILVPTTCGTGSEVTNIAILELIGLGTKKGLSSKEMFADSAVLIPELLKGLPFKVFASSSIDALIHAVESALSPNGNEITRIFSYKAIEMILKGYTLIRKKGEDYMVELLDEFSLASLLAGIAFSNAGCAAVHALSYPLGAKYHVPHGEANYAVLSGVMSNYLEIKTDGEIEILESFISDVLGCGKKEAFVKLEELLGCILIKKRLSEYGVKEAELETFAKSVIENQGRLMKNNFVKLDEERVLKIYKELY
ncbi:4-hydroxybutyrate dehydrogenase [uncultured Anaerofustis sp.]|uniref:4-hydroxybutyrate dehydrogenase n=1 Tax=uncultured Anaerofustis sp. TaxID=904996 RepID=UPI0025F0D5B4|nr:4-hydroxybutyrate dehydrogenase [uncultured Anaerofustis sp.]